MADEIKNNIEITHTCSSQISGKHGTSLVSKEEADAENHARIMEAEAVPCDLVDFDSPSDPHKPINWPLGKKLFTTIMYGLITASAALATSMFAPSVYQLEQQFNISPPIAALGTSMLLIGFGIGPTFWAPLSELYGRKWTILLPTFVSAIFSFSTAAAKDTETILISRLFTGVFGSAAICNTGGVLADIWSAQSIGLASVIHALALMGCPTLGPVFGSLIVVNASWRWTEYTTGIFQTTLAILGSVFLEESYPAALLVRKARRLRLATGNWALHAKHEEWDASFAELRRKYLSRPFRILVTPICFFLSVYASFVYGILYATLSAFPVEFQEDRGWGAVAGSLPFLAITIGTLFGAVAQLANQTYYKRCLRNNNNRAVPEARLPPMIIGSVLFAGGLFLFAWTSGRDWGWIFPCIGAGMAGFGFYTIFLSTAGYLIDTFRRHAASAVAAYTFMRSVFAGPLPVFMGPVLRKTGVKWGMTIFACLAVVLLPIPWILFVFGKRIRAKGQWSRDSVS